jgi:hypothetical protein
MLMLLRADLFCALAGCLEPVLSPDKALSSYGFNRRDELGSRPGTGLGRTEFPRGLKNFRQRCC